MPKTNEELSAEIFKQTTRDGCTASAPLQRRAFVTWMASGVPSGYANLAARMNYDEPMPQNTAYPYHRCADALVQKLRKAEVIEVKAAKWSLTDRGQEFFEHVAETLRSERVEP